MTFLVLETRRVNVLKLPSSSGSVGNAHTKSRRVPLAMDFFLFHAEINVVVKTIEAV